MSATIELESPGLLVARISGQLTRAAMQAMQSEAEPLVRAASDMCFLIILDGFAGWAAEPGWEDMSFAEANDQHLARMAIVGEEKWRDQALMFTLAGLRPVDIRYFGSAEEHVARDWLQSG